jgi:hypothetical protein
MGAGTQEMQPEKGLTFEKVWAMFQETDKKFQETDKELKETGRLIRETRESQKETDRQMKESKAEHDRLIRETRESQKETDRQMKETDKKLEKLGVQIGGVTGSLGDMAEGLMASDLYEHFEAQGLDFDSSFQNYVLKEKKTKLAEVDMLLVTGTIAMAVETKTTMTRGDVDKHEKRLEILRRVPNSLFANRTLYGAMAAVKTSRKAREYAIEKGFYFIELSGGTVRINVPEGFSPKTW